MYIHTYVYLCAASRALSPARKRALPSLSVTVMYSISLLSPVCSISFIAVYTSLHTFVLHLSRSRPFESAVLPLRLSFHAASFKSLSTPASCICLPLPPSLYSLIPYNPALVTVTRSSCQLCFTSSFY